MAKQRNKLISETTMYSVDKTTGNIVTHHLPWPRTSPQLETYTAKGLTFERPSVEPQNSPLSDERRDLSVKIAKKMTGEANKCDFPSCGFIAKTQAGLSVHRARSHKKGV